MPKIENKESLEAALKREINLFIGSGFSVLAKDKTGKNLPTGAALAQELCAKFNQPKLINQALPQLSQIIKAKDRTSFNEFLKARFTVGKYDERYNSVMHLAVTRVFTTNIDDLFTNIFNNSSNKYLNDLILQGATFRDRSAVEYLPLHGSVAYPNPDFTFTPIEIASAFSNNPTQFQYLASCIKKSPTLFLGYSLQDAGTLQSLNQTFSDVAQEKGRWIQLLDGDDAAIEYFKSLNFSIIISDTAEFLDYLQGLSGVAQSAPPNSLSHASFLSGRIPSINEAPVRPIADYFRGHAPTWYDVITRRIPATSNYNILANHIDSGRNVLISGIPVSGKSTLLMQAAAYHDTQKIKLFEDVITPEKAHAIVNQTSGKGNIILFIDNIGDSVDALDILTARPEIQVVGADRSVNIGFGSHRFNLSRFVSLDCSDLLEADFSRIFDAIPPALRKERMVVPDVNAQYRPSTFEFIEANVNGQSISDRYKEVLRKLRTNQQDLHDLFVMICYIFSCHTSASFDVVSRFMGANGDYELVYNAIARLGKLLGEIDTTDTQFIDLDDSQDHFTPRSSIISETVVTQCRDDDFRRVYLNFHRSVPRLFIPRFSSFRRFGYRSSLVERVFPDWNEGEKFYLSAYQEDNTYFLKQQLAIYLGIRKQYELAFKYIDEALTESRNRNPNIRHTHARLLFDANIEKAATDSSLRENLRKSMEILEGCHEYDKRQTNHAIRFAEQSLKYAAVFPGREASTYMETASGWLLEELEKSPSLRHARSLNNQIRRKLGKD